MKPSIKATLASAKFLSAFYEAVEKSPSVYCSLSYTSSQTDVTCYSVDDFKEFLAVAIVMTLLYFLYSERNSCCKRE
jgi:hypothetical protein